MELVIATTASLAVASLVLGLRLGGGDHRARTRIAALHATHHPDTLATDTRDGLPTQDAAPRHTLPGRMAVRLGTWLPGPAAARIERVLGRAGMRLGPGEAALAAVTWLALVGTGTSAALLSTDLRGGTALLVAALALMALVAPWVLLQRRARLRTQQIGRALPQALDLIVTNVEAGLGLQAALLVVARKFEGPLGDEFSRATAEISVGVAREQALAAMAERTGSDDVNSVARAIAQAERSGISIGQLLRARSVEMRERRRLRAREQANKVPVKMTIPVVLFIFPTFFLLILTPVALNAAEVMGQ